MPPPTALGRDIRRGADADYSFSGQAPLVGSFNSYSWPGGHTGHCAQFCNGCTVCFKLFLSILLTHLTILDADFMDSLSRSVTPVKFKTILFSVSTKRSSIRGKRALMALLAVK